jgi:hypothetical protein
VLSHSTAEVHGESMLEVMRQLNERGGTPIRARTRQELIRFFDGMELLDPGVVSCSFWRPDPVQLGTRPRFICSAVWVGFGDASRRRLGQ